jgi:hypothetical protein
VQLNGRVTPFNRVSFDGLQQREEAGKKKNHRLHWRCAATAEGKQIGGTNQMLVMFFPSNPCGLTGAN